MTSRRNRRARDVLGRGEASHVQVQRERLFGALGIIAVTRAACQTLEDSVSIMDALEVVYDVVNDVAGALEKFAETKKERASDENASQAE